MSQFSYNPNPQSTARGSSGVSSAKRKDSTTTNTLPYFSEEQKAAMVAERKRKEKEEKERKEKARLEAIEAEKQRQRDSKAAWEAAEQERLMERAKSIAPDYRKKYDAEEPQTFNDAKRVADETYMQFWYDKANEISSKWTDEDYALIAEPQYEEYYDGPRHKKTRRVVPEGYDEYVEAQERINAGPLDFSSEETHRMLIEPPKVAHRGYGKRQQWIDESNPLRQAVEAQADVMKDFLDSEGISIVREYEDLEGFDRPDSFRGEGIYLNTGTGAHIDWDSGLKRMQRYRSSPDAELGTYSQVFVRPKETGFVKPLSILGTLTGNTWLTAAATLAAGGDLEDAVKGAAKSYAIGQVTAPILENIITPLGIDKDLFGMDAEAFSESTMDVQTAILEGKDIEEALLKEFGVPAVKQIAGVLPDINIDLPESQFLSDLGDALEPLENVVKAGVDPLVDVAQEGINFVQEVTQPISDVLSEGEDVVKDLGREFDKTVLQPIGDVLEAGGDVLGGMLGGGQQDYQQRGISQTPVENIFDKELFKFDTEIKSTQEMLSPMMNLRRYG